MPMKHQKLIEKATAAKMDAFILHAVHSSGVKIHWKSEEWQETWGKPGAPSTRPTFPGDYFDTVYAPALLAALYIQPV